MHEIIYVKYQIQDVANYSYLVSLSSWSFLSQFEAAWCIIYSQMYKIQLLLLQRKQKLHLYFKTEFSQILGNSVYANENRLFWISGFYPSQGDRWG